MIPDRLEVAADEKEVDGVAILLLERGYLCVYGVELAVAAAFDGNLCVYARGLLSCTAVRCTDARTFMLSGFAVQCRDRLLVYALGDLLSSARWTMRTKRL